MALYDLKITEYLEQLRAKTPTPGGGAVAALTGAQAVALIMMVEEFTLHNEKYAEWKFEAQGVMANCSTYYVNFIQAINDDAVAYQMMVDARKMPKDTEEQIAARKEAIAKATEAGIAVPMKVMHLCLVTMKQLQFAVGYSNPNLRTDLYVALTHLDAALKSSWVNVLINVDGVEDFQEKIRKELAARDVANLAEKFRIPLDEDLIASIPNTLGLRPNPEEASDGIPKEGDENQFPFGNK